MQKRILTSLLILTFFAVVAAQERVTEVKVLFKVNVTRVDPTFANNSLLLDSLVSLLQNEKNNVTDITFCGTASPEGGYRHNQWLANHRRDNLAAYVRERVDLPDSIITLGEAYIDWPGLIELVEADPNTPCRDQVLDIVKNEPERTYDIYGRLIASRKDRLMSLHRGEPWFYMLEHFYPVLRNACAVIVTFQVPEPEPEPIPEPEPEPEPLPEPEPEPVVEEIAVMEAPADTAEILPNRYWSLHTNMLYDLALLPNIGAEVYLGKDFSLAANWTYGWWDTDNKHRYWRAYGGYIAGRWWFGKAAHAKPLTGHHIGIYAQTLTYDFEFGGKGTMAGEPGGNIFDRAHFACGIEYGFSLPIKRRLNIDFTIGIGYMGGRYYEYIPIDNCYVWQATKDRNWWGPTKIEVSLVWLLGRGNVNKKGGDL